MICPRCGSPVAFLHHKTNAILSFLSEGLRNAEIARLVGMTEPAVSTALTRFYSSTDTTRNEVVRYWNCELFRIGLDSLGLLPQKEPS